MLEKVIADSTARLFIILIVPLFPQVAGMFGMNVEVPMRDVESLWPFFTITACMIIAACIALVLAKRAHFM